MQGYFARRDSGRLALLARMAQVAMGIYIAAWGVVALFSVWRMTMTGFA